MLLNHYCSNETFINILKNKKLWLSELTLSNDSKEGSWIWKLVLDECKRTKFSLSDQAYIKAVMESCLAERSAFGFCLSEDGDLLSQWRGYADDGAGVAIGFSIESLQALCNCTTVDDRQFSLHEVEYGEGVQAEFASSYVERVKQGIDAAIKISSDNFQIQKFMHQFAMFGGQIQVDAAPLAAHMDVVDTIASQLFLLKNPKFKEEKEWRILCPADIDAESWVLENTVKPITYTNRETIEFRSREGCIVPYIELALTEAALMGMQKVFLGPRNRTPKHVVQTLLANAGPSRGGKDVVVEHSAATYR